jgi:hypothetical protein
MPEKSGLASLVPPTMLHGVDRVGDHLGKRGTASCSYRGASQPPAPTLGAPGSGQT